MIKLSVFMLDPVKAHERYCKEVAELEAVISKEKQSKRDVQVELKQVKDKMKTYKTQLTTLQNKLNKE